MSHTDTPVVRRISNRYCILRRNRGIGAAFQEMIGQVNERTRKIKNSEEQAQQSKEMMEDALIANQKLLENTQSQNIEICKIGKEKMTC